MSRRKVDILCKVRQADGVDRIVPRKTKDKNGKICTEEISPGKRVLWEYWAEKLGGPRR